MVINHMYKSMKKIELHLHLDGCVRTTTACKLLNQENLEKDMVVDSSNSSLSEYLKKFDVPNRVMQTQQNLTLISKELIEDLKKDGVIYAEVRFSPLLHTKNGLSFNQIIDAVLEGLKDDFVQTNLILCMMRNATKEENLRVIKAASDYLEKGVVGIDLAGDESKYPTYLFQDLFNRIYELQIPLTVHAGEAASYSNIEAAINHHANRIGHGIRLIDNQELLNEVKKKKIPLEICLTSNVQTKAVSSYLHHPIKKLMEQGILVTVNTDNRTVSNTTLSHEYELLNQYFGFSIHDFKALNMNAVRASFLSKEEKLKLLQKIS